MSARGDRNAKLASRAVQVGFVAALLTLDEAEVAASGRAGDEIVRELVDEVNHDRTRAEQIKRFVVLPREFSLEEGEVTPTLKLRRKVVIEHYRDVIESLYGA